jgi:hypothetical protein
MEMSLLLLMNHIRKLQTNLSIPMMGGVRKTGGGGGGDHEESPLSNWEATKEEAGNEEIEREVESLGARFQSPRIDQQTT